MVSNSNNVNTNLAVGIVNVGSKGGYSYKAAKLYQRQKSCADDEHYFWAWTGVVGPWRRGTKVVEDDAKKLANLHNCELLYIRHGDRVE